MCGCRMCLRSQHVSSLTCRALIEGRGHALLLDSRSELFARKRRRVRESVPVSKQTSVPVNERTPDTSGRFCVLRLQADVCSRKQADVCSRKQADGRRCACSNIQLKHGVTCRRHPARPSVASSAGVSCGHRCTVTTCGSLMTCRRHPAGPRR